MDGSLAIEWNRQALKCIVATLSDMAGLATDPDPEARAEGDDRKVIPRILWHAILRLLRPAESAARRLIIATARGLVVPPPTPRQPKPPTMEPLLRRLGIAVMVTPADRAAILPRFTGEGDHAKRGGGGAESCARLSLPLFDPPRRLALYRQRHSRHVPPRASSSPASANPPVSHRHHRPRTSSAPSISAGALPPLPPRSTICRARLAALPG